MHFGGVGWDPLQSAKTPKRLPVKFIPDYPGQPGQLIDQMIYILRPIPDPYLDAPYPTPDDRLASREQVGDYTTEECT
jgi:hypothetical protein